MSGNLVLEAKSVSKFFGTITALQNVDLHLNKGEVLGVEKKVDKSRAKAGDIQIEETANGELLLREEVNGEVKVKQVFRF